MTEQGEFTVHDVVTRQTPVQTTAGRTALTTVITFSVGPHGPFTLVFNGEDPNPAAILAAITARVNALKATAAALAQLNQQSAAQ